ncbi:hypothetical protein DSUL_60262 [Desulfovibrionales bacterium]
MILVNLRVAFDSIILSGNRGRPWFISVRWPRWQPLRRQ